MTILLLLFFDHFFGRGILAPHPALMVLAIASGLIEFHYKGWQQFIAVMRLWEMESAAKADPAKMSASQWFLGRCTLCVGLLWDVGMNVLATFWLLQLPFRRTSKSPHYSSAALNFLFQRTWLLSSRLEENVFGKGTTWPWQKKLSERFRQELLDNGDPRGIHRS